MAKQRRPATARPTATTTVVEPASPADTPASGGTREMVESLVIAFLLAFLFRTFEAEAFQIPTGSMGPTLMGRHKDLDCPACGYEYQTGSSIEIDDDTEQFVPRFQVVSTTCPVCRFTASVGPKDPTGRTPSYKGDRIWVSKAPYEMGDPRRWDVAVFKYPLRAQVNYIKRIVGLPNEKLQIYRGDIFVENADDQPVIQTKPDEKLRAMRQIVYDNDCRLANLIERGLPARWSYTGDLSADAGAWTTSDTAQSFSTNGASSDTLWLRYRHMAPSYEEWQAWQGVPKAPIESIPGPQLVSDFCAYNTASVIIDPDRAPDAASLGMHWVGDLMLECSLSVLEAKGEVTLELIEGGKRFHCRLDLATGTATLGIVGADSFATEGKTNLNSPGTHKVAFSNFDNELRLWVDEMPVHFARPTGYPELGNDIPMVDDLEPVAIGARGAKVVVNHLQIWRDLYYVARASSTHEGQWGAFMDYAHNPYLSPTISRAQVIDFFSDPKKWSVFGGRIRAKFDLEADEFFPLGDNSPNSSDARFWDDEPYVRRDLLVGKALFVYWPHAWETHPSFRVPGFQDLRVPFYPNFARMRAIH